MYIGNQIVIKNHHLYNLADSVLRPVYLEIENIPNY